MKTHLKINGVDFRGNGQTEFEYDHQTACGFVRNSVTRNGDNVDCKLCIKSEHMRHYHQINQPFSDSQGAI